MTLASLKAKAEEVLPTRPDLILQPASAAQIGAGRHHGWRPAGHFYFANLRTFQLLRHSYNISVERCGAAGTPAAGAMSPSRLGGCDFS